MAPLGYINDLMFFIIYFIIKVFIEFIFTIINFDIDEQGRTNAAFFLSEDNS